MKPIYSLMALGLALLTMLYACDDHSMELSQVDEATLLSLQEAYGNAFDENELIKNAIEHQDSLAIHLHDSLFHYHEGLFEEHHNDYSHNNDHDDHHHDTQGMHMMGNTMNHMGQDGHHMEDHDLMKDLLTDHRSFMH